MAQVIKISLVLSGEDNAVEYHRLLPESYFNKMRVDLFTEEINSLREEAHRKNPELKACKDCKEHIRIAAIDTDSGEVWPKARTPED